MENLEQRIARAVQEDVAIAPYDPRWPLLFDEEKQRLRAWLPGDLIGHIEHFGSTAVPGLAAKPIVDMLVEVADLDEARRRVVPVLESKGYDYFWRPTWGDDVPPWYAWFIRRNAAGIRTHHIHMVEAHFEHWDRLLFRDYLIRHAATALEYQALKRQLAAAYPNDRVAYTRGKTEFIASVMDEALPRDYLSCSETVDWREPAIANTARDLTRDARSDVDAAKRLFEWVRDNISHSCDAGHETVTCRASDVLRLRTGLCFAKSHLLVAMFRAAGIPAGFCYQRLRYDDGAARMILHGLCAAYLKSLRRWVRVDPRGNKPGVDAQFRLDRPQLAFPTRRALGEVLYPSILVDPLPSVVQCLRDAASVSEALARLPDSLDPSTAP